MSVRHSGRGQLSPTRVIPPELWDGQGQPDRSRMRPALKVVLPAYREGRAMLAGLERLTQALSATRTTWEVVVDGDPSTEASTRECESAQLRVVG